MFKAVYDAHISYHAMSMSDSLDECRKRRLDIVEEKKQKLPVYSWRSIDGEWYPASECMDKINAYADSQYIIMLERLIEKYEDREKSARNSAEFMDAHARSHQKMQD